MKEKLLIYILISVILFCCNGQNTESFKKKKTKKFCKQKLHIVNKSSKTIRTRFNCPKGFERVAVKSNSFGEYLQNSELKPVKDINFMKIGDIFIQKGRPYGHAVIVVDMGINKKNRNKIFILAQSYMPAQEIQILVNQQENQISPWYKLRNSTIYTPEWTFNPEDLHRFKNK